ncbi:MAG: hypothetical protein JNK40_11955 [Chromatiales bacterium]|nr:hypothetical protein [Chromatiales bacterium]
MPGKWPDTQFRREIRDFNREFLELVCTDTRPGSAFGLPPTVRQRLALLAPAQLEVIAATPCLLAAFVVLPPRQLPLAVAEDPGSGPGLRVNPAIAPRTPEQAGAQAESARLFAASLLTWLWHTTRQDRLLAALCIGPGRLGVEQLASAGFRDLQRAAAGGMDSLEARFCRHPRLWPDLVRAASRADAQVLMATQLSVVQLTLISRR